MSTLAARFRPVHHEPNPDASQKALFPIPETENTRTRAVDSDCFHQGILSRYSGD
jgi:hypothetical protein